jgi:hypothetical protein
LNNQKASKHNEMTYTHKIGPKLNRSLFFNRTLAICIPTYDFPVPGGPWISAISCLNAEIIAVACPVSRLVTAESLVDNVCGSSEIDIVSGVMALLSSLAVAVGMQERSRVAF